MDSIGEEDRGYFVYISWGDATSNLIHILRSNLLLNLQLYITQRHLDTLQHVHTSPHVTLAELYHGLYPFLADVQVLLVGDVPQPVNAVLLRDGLELKLRASGLQRRDHLAGVVADQAKARVICPFFDCF